MWQQKPSAEDEVHVGLGAVQMGREAIPTPGTCTLNQPKWGYGRAARGLSAASQR